MRRTNDRGAAAVEFALVLPLLLVIVFGLIDFGRMLNAQITVTEAAREGARADALGTSVVSRVNLVGANLGPAGTVQSTINTNCASLTSTDAKVTTSYDFQFVTPVGLLVGAFGGPVTLTGVGVMPCRG